MILKLLRLILEILRVIVNRGAPPKPGPLRLNSIRQEGSMHIYTLSIPDETATDVATLIALLLLCCTASAAEIQTTATVHDPKIPLYGTQADNPVGTFDPSTSDETVVVPAGVTHEFAATETALDILVRGTLRITGNLTFRTLTAVDGGAIEITEPATLTIRNLPIDVGTKEQPGIDPSAYGHGLLVINSALTTHAPSWRKAFAQLAAEVHAGDETLTFAAAPHGWQAGDKLVLPDTRQPATGSDLSAQTETAMIASVQHGQSVTLTAPVQFDHLGWHKSDGSVGLLPDVANLTQPIVIRSENPAGVRGHVFITAASHQDVEGVCCVEMGRTSAAPLHSTLRDDQGNIAQIGTNQIGRYAWHHHHLLGRGNQLPSPQFRLENVSVDGSPKWGIAVHGSHFGLVNDCAVYNAAGSGIVTEDAWVYGNKITNNIVIPKQPGSGQRITERAHRNLAGGDHWHDRGGLGLASAMNEVTGNRLYCCKESIGMAGFATQNLYKPTEPGVCPTCSEANRVVFAEHMGRRPPSPRRYPFLFPTSGNVAWGGWRAIETWTADCYVDLDKMFPGYTIVHCRIPTDFEDQEETTLYGWRILGDFSKAVAPTAGGLTNSYALNWKDGYRFGITAVDCEVRGYDAVYRSMQDTEYTRFIGGAFEGPTFIYQPQGQIIRLKNATGWEFSATNSDLSGIGKFIDSNAARDIAYWIKSDSQTRSLVPITIDVRPWRDGRDLRLYHWQQHRDFALPVRTDGKAYGDWPVGINTHAQLLALDPPRPIFGAVIPETAFQDAAISATFWADDVSPSCEEQLRRAMERIKELEGQ